MRISSDQNRFKDIVRNKIKHSLGKYVSSDQLIAQQGKKKISIPIHSIDLPSFIFGSNNGGVGQGNGDAGDPLSDGKQKGKAGDATAEHEFSQEEFAQIVLEYLELPKLEPKQKGETTTEAAKYNSISKSGNDSLRHFKRSFKEGLKRSIADNSYDPNNPYVVPIKDDFRYRTSSTKDAPEIKAAILYIIDTSGSMTDEIRKLAKSMSFWIDLLLSNSYKNLESAFIIHDAEASEVSRDEFFSVSSGGGTKISSAYELCSDIIDRRFQYSEYNNYIIQFSDGGNLSNEDNNLCIELLKSIKDRCNFISYSQVKSPFDDGDFIQVLDNSFRGDEKIKLNLLNGEDDIFPAVKTIFSV